jgi:hypothetical protein
MQFAPLSVYPIDGSDFNRHAEAGRQNRPGGGPVVYIVSFSQSLQADVHRQAGFPKPTNWTDAVACQKVLIAGDGYCDGTTRRNELRDLF